MFVVYNKEKQLVPIKVWLGSEHELDETCRQQAINLSNLPFVHKHVALMPDTHAGYGMPIGGVIAADNIIIPHAVGNDIGCGMCFVSTDIPVDSLKKISRINTSIMSSIPLGTEKHRKKQAVPISEFPAPVEAFEKEMENIQYQFGTLGGGNHFIELQKDKQGNLCVMVHSGSRHLGMTVCQYFNKKAVALNKKWFSAIDAKWQLAFLPVDSDEGKQYISWMDFACTFARENRIKILETVLNILVKYKPGLDFSDIIECQHNYAALEHHFGRDLWIHRKGAVRARNGEFGIIPGAMGSRSYIVKGTGNKDSFCSCSHGAGRKFGRAQAKKRFNVVEITKELQKQNVVLNTPNKSSIAEECRHAYKNIDMVMKQQNDLAVIVKQLETVSVVKG